MSRVPVCADCLAKPEPLSAEYFCASCRTPFLSSFPLDDHGICGLCRRGANGFDAAYSYGAYEDELRGLIHLLKYGKVQTVAGPLGKLLAQALPRDQRFDVIVPMPMHWWRKWRRGFNQAELLASVIGRRTGLPVRDAMGRRWQKQAQAGLTNAKRRANVEGAFRAKKPRAVQGKRVLLIDDVMTTGATASSCARVLKRAGASYVALLTVARVDRRVAAAELKSSDSFPESTFSGSFEDAKSGSFA